MITENLEEGREYSGAEFNALNEATLIKLTTADLHHNSMVFQEGLNVDPIPFSPSDYCSPGGIYFCDIDYFDSWLYYAENIMVYYYDVIVPDDARVYVEKQKMKADKIILQTRHLVCELFKTNSGLSAYCQKLNKSRQKDPARDVQAIWNYVLEKAPHCESFLPVIAPKDQTDKHALSLIKKHKLAYICDFKSHVFTKEVIDALISVGYNFESSSKIVWTKDIWMYQINRGYTTNVLNIPDAMCDDEMKTLLLEMRCIDKDNIQTWPVGMQTREGWEAYLLKHKNVVSIPTKFRDQEMLCFLKKHAMLNIPDIDFLRESLQTRQMWEDAICQKLLRKDSLCIPEQFNDADMKKLLVRHGYCQLSDMRFSLRKNVFSQELFDICVERKEWTEIALFPPSYFNQQTYTTLFDAGYPLDSIPKDYQTRDMYLFYVRNRRITWFAEVPLVLRSDEIWEELVQANVKNVRFVLSDQRCLSDRMIQTVISRHKTHLLPKDCRPAPERSIVKRRKRKDWSRR